MKARDLGIVPGTLAVLYLFLAIDSRADDPVEEAAIVTLATDDPLQGRASITVDPILTQAAQVKADDMLARDYFAHTDPDGCGPNFLVRSFGYVLPSNYGTAKDANNIESLFKEFDELGFGIAPPDADNAWAAWLESPGHRAHVLAEDSFYEAQIMVGVGIASDGFDNYYVFLSAPPPGTDTKGPNMTYDKPRFGTRARRMMRHKGTASDASGIESVSIRTKGSPWVAANYGATTDKWTGKTRLKSREWKKIKKGRLLVVRIQVRDNAGNTSHELRKFRR